HVCRRASPLDASPRLANSRHRRGTLRRPRHACRADDLLSSLRRDVARPAKRRPHPRGGRMINFAVDEPRRHLVENYIARGWGEPLRDRIRQFTYTELFRAGELEPGTWIFTGI